MWDMTHSYAGNDLFISGVYMLRDCFNVSMCDLTQYCVKYDFFFDNGRVLDFCFDTGIRMRGMTHINVRSDSYMCVTLKYVWRDSSISALGVSNICISHNIRMNSHVTHMNSSCHTHASTMPFRWIKRVPYVNKCQWFTSHVRIINATQRLIHPNLDGTIYAYEYHDWFTCYPWLNRIYATWHICKCDMTHSYMKPASFIQVTWRVHTSSMTHSHTWYD